MDGSVAASIERPERFQTDQKRGMNPPAQLDLVTMIGFTWRWCTIDRKRSGLFTGPFFSPHSWLGWFF